MRILVWFRNDLRLHDHEPLQAALQAQAQVIPVYCFDPRQFGKTAFGFPKTGSFRAQFLVESVQDLRDSLRRLGSDLMIRREQPEDILPGLAAQMQADAAHWHRAVTSEETTVEGAVANALETCGVTVRRFWGGTLYHPQDLPFPVTALPPVFTHFRKQVEGQSTVRPGLPTPSYLPALPPEWVPGEVPDLSTWGLAPPFPDDRASLSFVGGETAGLARLHHYLWEADCLRTYKQTRNGLLRADDSSKFSPWLALGCLSPRHIYHAVRAYEAERVKNESTYWLIFELLWRDYFRFIAMQQGDRLFYPSGIQGLPIAWEQDWSKFWAWSAGKTGYPLVDGNLRELAATGFMSNRGRQNVASFLTKNLGVDWRMGAEWFESWLIDYDVCSNWGNWNYLAGVGNDARGFRYFNILKQAQDYDPQGHYVKHWLPELRQIPPSLVHQPWRLSPDEQRRFNVRLGVDYPEPIVDLQASVAVTRQRYETAVATRRERPSGDRERQKVKDEG